MKRLVIVILLLAPLAGCGPECSKEYRNVAFGKLMFDRVLTNHDERLYALDIPVEQRRARLEELKAWTKTLDDPCLREGYLWVLADFENDIRNAEIRKQGSGVKPPPQNP